MDGIAYFQRLARYNQWANQLVLDACARLDQGALDAPRRAFFPSIMKTLNHILVADILWMSRLAGQPRRIALDHILHGEFGAFRTAREVQDGLIITMIDDLAEPVLETGMTYQSMLAGSYTMERAGVLGHLFNHQTHHRGQLHSMLLDAGIEPPAIDLIYYMRDA